MSFNLRGSLVSVAALCVVMAGCGGAQSDSGFIEPAITDLTASTLALSSDDVEERAPTYQHDRYNLEAVIYRLRNVAAPLFQHYGLRFGEDWDESRAFRRMLLEVSFVVKNGVVTVTNKATGGVIFIGPLNNPFSGVFSPANIPGAGTPPPPSACTYATGAWGACQSNGTQTRIVMASPTGCTGTPPASSQSCVYVPPTATCTAFTFNAWTPAICPASGQQTRTVATSTPAGCSGGNPVLAQTCTPPPPPPPVTCASFTYSAWATCSASGTQTRTVTSSAPAGCTGGSPVLSQACTPPPPPLDGGALYTQYCSSCHGNGKKGSSVSAIQNAISSNRGGMGSLSGLTAAQIQAISSAP
jgi:hypothetical protein